MKSKLLITLFVAFGVIALTSGVKKVDHVAGYSGGGTGCSCHGTAKYSPTNIFITGIPSNAIAGQSYPMSITVTATGGQKFGMNISTGATGGTFATTNTYAKITSTKYAVEHTNPPAATNTYTWNNITWTAPATAGVVSFKYCGIAGKGTSGQSAVGVYRDTFSVNVTSVTPVKFSSFTLERGGRKIEVSWKTVTETSVDHFEIEKSINGKDFTFVNSIITKGNTASGNAYSYADYINTFSEILYYRIKSVDLNGTYSYSEVKSINIKPIKQLSVYPNPVNRGEAINLGFSSLLNDIATINIFDTKGMLLCTQRKAVVTGENIVGVVTNKITKEGNYLVIVHFDNISNAAVESAPFLVR